MHGGLRPPWSPLLDPSRTTRRVTPCGFAALRAAPSTLSERSPLLDARGAAPPVVPPARPFADDSSRHSVRLRGTSCRAEYVERTVSASRCTGGCAPRGPPCSTLRGRLVASLRAASRHFVPRRVR